MLIHKTAPPPAMFPGALQPPRPTSPWALQWRGHDQSLHNLMHFRYYASSRERFLKSNNIIPDLTNPQNWNAYTYVKGNPVNFNDPSGHFAAGLGGRITQMSMKNILFGPGGSYLPTAFEYGGTWNSKEIFEYFGVKPIYITLNAVIDETMTKEKQEKAKKEFEEQLEKANKVYNKLKIYIGAEYNVGPVPSMDFGEEEFSKEAYKLSIPGRINIFLSNKYHRAQSGIYSDQKTAISTIPVCNSDIDSWHLTHELGHIFGFNKGPNDFFLHYIFNFGYDVFFIDSFIYYERFLILIEPLPVVYIKWFLLRNASVWGE